MKKKQPWALRAIEPKPQSVVSLTSMTVWLVLAAFSSSLVVSPSDEAINWSAFTNLAQKASQDASWLLPALLAANLGLLAILIAGSLTSPDSRTIESTRRILTASSLFVGAAAGATAILAVIGALAEPASTPRLFAVLVLTAVVIGLSMWISVLFFGADEVQLALISELRRSTHEVLNRLGPLPAIPIWVLYLVNVFATAITALATYVAVSIAFGTPMPNPAVAAVLLVLLIVFVSLGLLVTEQVIAEWRLSVGRWGARIVTFVVIAGPILVSSVGLMHSGLVSAGLSIFISLTGVAALTWTNFRVSSKGLTLGAVSNALTRNRLDSRVAQLDERARALHEARSLLARL